MLCCADLGPALPGYWWITIQRREEAEIGFSLCLMCRAYWWSWQQTVYYKENPTCTHQV